MENEQKNVPKESVYAQRLRAGKRRTYFFDVRTTKSGDYFITITESKKRFDDEGYDRHKVFIYKEDFNKFAAALNKTIDHVKQELMPDYNFDEFTREPEDYTNGASNNYNGQPAVTEDELKHPEPQLSAEPIESELDDLESEDLSF